MDYSFIIRKAKIDEASYIKEVMEDSFGLYKSRMSIDNELDAEKETIEDIKNDISKKEVFIAFIDDIPVGSIRISITEAHIAEISRFGVKQEFHNIGIGKALMNLADKYLRSKNTHLVCLHTASRYSGLMRFYYGRGFYVHSTSFDRGYIRALMKKEYTY